MREGPNLDQGQGATWIRDTAQLGADKCPTWIREMPNLDEIHAQLVPGACPAWTRHMSTLDQAHAQPEQGQELRLGKWIVMYP